MNENNIAIDFLDLHGQICWKMKVIVLSKIWVVYYQCWDEIISFNWKIAKGENSARVARFFYRTVRFSLTVLHWVGIQIHVYLDPFLTYLFMFDITGIDRQPSCQNVYFAAFVTYLLKWHLYLYIYFCYPLFIFFGLGFNGISKQILFLNVPMCCHLSYIKIYKYKIFILDILFDNFVSYKKGLGIDSGNVRLVD